MARQARFSTAWHRAVVSEVRITNGRTHVSVIWSDGTTTLAIPLLDDPNQRKSEVRGFVFFVVHGQSPGC